MATVFALGSNGSGQLGIGHAEDVSIPRNVLFVGEPPASIAVVAAGGNHSLILDGAGKLYWSGDATTGACGNQVPNSKLNQPAFAELQISTADGRVGIPGRVGLIAATWEGSVFTVLDGEGKNTRVFSCGMGQKGELGQGPLVIRDPKASEIKDFPPANTAIVDLSASMSHTVAVLDNGDVYGWGNGRKGQIGSPDEIVFVPRKIAGVGFAVKRAVCGKDFSCLVGDSEKGELLVLGQDKWNIKSDAPAAVPGWIDIGAGWGNICILKSDGTIMSWGRNDYTQSTPPADQKATKIAVGSEHVVALLETGDVFAWGWGEHGNCGPIAKQTNSSDSSSKGQRKAIASAKFLPPGTSILGIGAGCATSWIIVGDKNEA